MKFSTLIKSIAVSSLLSLPNVLGHAVLTKPQPRANTNDGSNGAIGDKIVGIPPSQADLNSCGVTTGGGPEPATGAVPTANKYTLNYQVTNGNNLLVTWTTTLPHPNPPGVAVKLITTPTQTWQTATTLETGADIALGQVTVKIPAGTSCAACVLQWSWISNNDGGMYIGCADISINPPAVTPSSAAPSSPSPSSASTATDSPSSNSNSNTNAPTGAVNTNKPSSSSPTTKKVTTPTAFKRVGEATSISSNIIITLALTIIAAAANRLF